MQLYLQIDLRIAAGTQFTVYIPCYRSLSGCINYAILTDRGPGPALFYNIYSDLRQFLAFIGGIHGVIDFNVLAASRHFQLPFRQLIFSGVIAPILLIRHSVHQGQHDFMVGIVAVVNYIIDFTILFHHSLQRIFAE